MNQPITEKDLLLAEDDHDDVDIFKMALDELKLPYELRHAVDGDRLFILLKEKIPYILFLDIRMPCKDGIACIQEIRQNREFDRLPVIMYTSLLTDKLVEQSFRAGANYFLTKTSSFQALVLKLKKIFSMDWSAYLHYPPKDGFVMDPAGQ